MQCSKALNKMVVLEFALLVISWRLSLQTRGIVFRVIQYMYLNNAMYIVLDILTTERITERKRVLSCEHCSLPCWVVYHSDLNMKDKCRLDYPLGSPDSIRFLALDLLHFPKQQNPSILPNLAGMALSDR